MAEVTLRLTIDPQTGKKSVVIDYQTDADALPEEHEEEHRQLVSKVVEGLPLDGSGPVAVERESGAERGTEIEQDGQTEQQAVEQKG